jgi:flagellar protein FlaG
MINKESTMIEQSPISAGNPSVQVDSKPVKQAQISDISKTEVLKPEQVVAQVKENARAELPNNKVQETVASLNAFVQLMDRNVSFEVDETSGRDIISVFEKDTKELIRQIPSEETLELLKRMDNMVGVLFSENV